MTIAGTMHYAIVFLKESWADYRKTTKNYPTQLNSTQLNRPRDLDGKRDQKGKKSRAYKYPLSLI